MGVAGGNQLPSEAQLSDVTEASTVVGDVVLVDVHLATQPPHHVHVAECVVSVVRGHVVLLRDVDQLQRPVLRGEEKLRVRAELGYVKQVRPYAQLQDRAHEDFMVKTAAKKDKFI